MNDDDVTTHTDQATGVAGPSAAWLPVLTVVHHPDEAVVGRRHVLADDETLVLGRRSVLFGAGVFEDPRVSRRHLELHRRGESVSARDTGSHNGAFVNGEPIRDRALADGDVVTLGPVMLLLHWGPPFHEPPRHPVIIGVGAATAALLAHIDRVAESAEAVLIEGETGVGKELVARELHRLSRRSGAFVALNCGALGDGVVHSELFGHARGAFSGAGVARDGLVAGAAAGTLLLDEIGDATPALQASLLRLLESGEYRQVGSDKLLCSDARFVAATHVPLEEAVEQGRFRADLYGRLDRFTIHVAPLRERREDILPIARARLLARASRELPLGRSLALALLRYDWPRNVRELCAVIDQALVEAAGADSLHLSDALAKRLTPARRESPAAAAGPPPPDQLLARLRAHRGNVKALATELGVARTTIYRWFRAAGIDPTDR